MFVVVIKTSLFFSQIWFYLLLSRQRGNTDKVHTLLPGIKATVRFLRQAEGTSSKARARSSAQDVRARASERARQLESSSLI